MNQIAISNMKNEILVSVIVSTYNSERFIKGRIEDLLSQTIAKKTEIIIVNSGSLQNEDEIVAPYLSAHSNIKYVKTKERETIYKAWNRGIKLSRGEFITNANTDDRLKRDGLEKLSSALINNPDAALVYADQFITNIPDRNYEYIANNGKAKLHVCPDYNYFHELDRCLVFSQPMWRSSLHFKDNLWFDEKYEISGDYEFQLKVSQKYNLLHIPEPLGVFYLSPKKENKSHSNIEQVIDEREEISREFIEAYIESADKQELNRIVKKFGPVLSLPVPVLLISKRILLFMKPDLIKDKLFHTIEFIYFISIHALVKLNKIKDAFKMSKKITRYSRSKRLREQNANLRKIFTRNE